MDIYTMEVAAGERRRQAEEAAELRRLLRSAGLERTARRWSPARSALALTHGLARLVGGMTRRPSGRSLDEWMKRWERGR